MIPLLFNISSNELVLVADLVLLVLDVRRSAAARASAMAASGWAARRLASRRPVGAPCTPPLLAGTLATATSRAECAARDRKHPQHTMRPARDTCVPLLAADLPWLVLAGTTDEAAGGCGRLSRGRRALHGQGRVSAGDHASTFLSRSRVSALVRVWLLFGVRDRYSHMQPLGEVLSVSVLRAVT